MTRAKQMEDKRLMTFEELYSRRQAGRLAADDAAELLGVSTRTFRRRRARFEDEGEEGLHDRRLDRISSNKVPADETMKVLELFETRHFDCPVRHFATRRRPTAASRGAATGRVRSCRAAGSFGRRPPPQAPPASASRDDARQDASRHGRVPGVRRDLVVTMDDATSEIFSARFVDEEGTTSTFQGLDETISSKGLFRSLRADRGSRRRHAPEAGGKVGKGNPAQVGRAMRDLGIEMIAAHSPRARGRSERMFGTLGTACRRSFAGTGSRRWRRRTAFFGSRICPMRNARFSRPAEGEGTAFAPFHGDPGEHPVVQVDRMVRNDNAVSCKGRTLQISENRHRHRYARVNVRVREQPDERPAVFRGPRCIGRYESSGAALPVEA